MKNIWTKFKEYNSETIRMAFVLLIVICFLSMNKILLASFNFMNRKTNDNDKDVYLQLRGWVKGFYIFERPNLIYFLGKDYYEDNYYQYSDGSHPMSLDEAYAVDIVIQYANDNSFYKFAERWITILSKILDEISVHKLY